MKIDSNAKLLLDIFRAIETRDQKRIVELFHPDFEIHWPLSLPYGGSWRGLVPPPRPTWSSTWEPLQPTDAERRMDAKVIAANGNEVVVLWNQRGISASGERFEGQVLGLYSIADGKLVRAQMFYFDTAAVADFLSKAHIEARRNSEPGVSKR